MAVKENPYNKWGSNRENSDYRCNDTQVNSLVKQQLSQPEYLTSSNRVNPGPFRNKRAAAAELLPQVPHVFGNEDLWGWQAWADPSLNETLPYEDSGLSELKRVEDIPGASYTEDGQYSSATH